MGIRGLTTYISRNSDRYLEPYKLHDCYLVIDGNNLAAQLYLCVSRCNSAFGGDYDRYGACVLDFFQLLAKCSIRPLVIMDGGHETRKLSTVYSRLRDKFSTARNINPYIQNRLRFLPLLLWEVFKDVLRELNVPFAQCKLEADAEVAALARMLQCPVLSCDSDFYVFDVLYIPFSTVILEACSEEPDGQSYISCRIYRVENFLKTFGGLDKDMLPLMATLLGNDYIKREKFANFFSQIKMPKSRSLGQTQKQIAGLLEWLRRETLESAIAKILGHLKKQDRAFVEEQLESIMTGYIRCHSDLLQYLGLAEKFTERDKHSLKSKESIKISEIISSKPTWFKDHFSRGLLPSCFIDMLLHERYFALPQVEDFSLSFSHDISLPILRVIFGLLLEGKSSTLTYVGRLQAHLTNLAISCSATPPASSRKASYLFETLRFSSRDMSVLQKFPEDWQLYLAAMMYWARHVTTPQITAVHIQALLFSVIILNVVDSHAGYYHTKKKFLRENASKLRKIRKQKVSEPINVSTPNKEESPANDVATDKMNLEECKTEAELENILLAYRQVSLEDCLMLVEQLLPFRQLDETLKSRPKLFSITTMHIFSQFQSCLLHISYLNALLQFPLVHCKPARFYSGTLVYNSYSNFKKRNSVVHYLSTHVLNTAPSVLHLYNVLLQHVKYLLPSVFGNVTSNKKKPKKGKRYIKKDNEEEDKTLESAEEEPNDTLLANNKFRLLTIS